MLKLPPLTKILESLGRGLNRFAHLFEHQNNSVSMYVGNAHIRHEYIIKSVIYPLAAEIQVFLAHELW